MIEDDDAVRYIFFDAVAGERSVASLGGDHGGDATLFEPAEQAPQLGAKNRRVGEYAEQGFDRVDHDPFGANGVDRGAESQKESIEIPITGFFDLAANHLDVIDHELAFSFGAGKVEPE